MHPRVGISRSGSMPRPSACFRARIVPNDLSGTTQSHREVRAAAGDRRLASKLFETYRDQIANDGSDGSNDGPISRPIESGHGDDAPNISTRGERQKRLPARSRRGTGRSMQATSYTKGQMERRAKREKYFYTREDGSLRPLTGVHGNGQPQWWALRVTVGREKQTCTNIERRYQQMREAAEAEGTAEGMQEIETWDVWKRVRAWNPKSQKMGNKMVRFDGGGWVLVRAIMDHRIASIISGNINILGYQHREIFEGEEFPIPADNELINSLTAWQEDLKEITEDEVREELGLGPKRDDLDYFEDYEDYGRGRGNRRTRDGDGGQRAGDRRNAGLFSSQNSDDAWEDGSSWYGGSSKDTEEEGLFLDPSDDPIGYDPSGSDIDAVNEFGAWLGDFNASTGDNDWMGTTMSDDADARFERNTHASSHKDDLSWWDEDDAGHGTDVIDESDLDGVLRDGDIDAGQSTRIGMQAGMFTDNEPSVWSSIDDSSSGGDDAVQRSDARLLSIVNGEFKDFDGVLVEDGERIVKVEVDVFGLPTLVEIPREDVEFL